MGQTGEINVINQQIASRLADLEALVELWDEGSRDYQAIQTFLPQVPAQIAVASVSRVAAIANGNRWVR